MWREVFWGFSFFFDKLVDMQSFGIIWGLESLFWGKCLFRFCLFSVGGGFRFFFGFRVFVLWGRQQIELGCFSIVFVILVMFQSIYIVLIFFKYRFTTSVIIGFNKRVFVTLYICFIQEFLIIFNQLGEMGKFSQIFFFLLVVFREKLKIQ